MALGYPATHLDQALISPFYSADIHGFPLRHDPFLESFMHLGLKYLVIAIGLVTLGLLFWSFMSPQLRQYRRRLVWIFTGLVLAPAVVSILKHHSIHSCPWDIALYGGNAPLIELFAALPAGVKPGHCFPGGHASGGFALMAFYFGLRDIKPNYSRWILIMALILGFIMGWAQMVRGAHFMSHNIWSAWLVWMVLLALYISWPPSSKAIPPVR